MKKKMMTTLGANIIDLIWGAWWLMVASAALGYVAGNVFGIAELKGLIGKKMNKD
jgi:hypothetical protein